MHAISSSIYTATSIRVRAQRPALDHGRTRTIEHCTQTHLTFSFQCAHLAACMRARCMRRLIDPLRSCTRSIARCMHASWRDSRRPDVRTTGQLSIALPLCIACRLGVHAPTSNAFFRLWITSIAIMSAVAVVTGGSRGIGFAAARLLASHGASVAVLARCGRVAACLRLLLRARVQSTDLSEYVPCLPSTKDGGGGGAGGGGAVCRRGRARIAAGAAPWLCVRRHRRRGSAERLQGKTA